MTTVGLWHFGPKKVATPLVRPLGCGGGVDSLGLFENQSKTLCVCVCACVCNDGSYAQAFPLPPNLMLALFR